MGLDARVRYTKMVIKNSFISLLKVKPVNKLEQDCLNELLQTVGSSGQHDFKDTFTLILVSLKADGELYQTLFSENGDKSFHNRIFALCYKSSAMDTDQKFQKLSPVQQKWLYYFIAQGCSGILGQWISCGMAEPIEEVVNFADRLFQNTISSF